MKNPIFEYCRFQTSPRGLMSDGESHRRSFAQRAQLSGGTLFGCWRSVVGLGLARDEGIALTAWPDEALARAAPVVEGAEQVILTATLRPTDDESPTSPGVYVFRWFGIEQQNWEAFAKISDAAWPNMESVFDTKIYGFWRSLESTQDRDDVLLLTRYADLSVWEASRWWNNPVKEANESMSRFARRNDMIDSTIAYPSFLINEQ